MLAHPWVQGQTAEERPLEGSDKRLSNFQVSGSSTSSYIAVVCCTEFVG
jgi:hypothetical protein